MSEEHGWIIGKDISAREFGDAFCKAVDMAIEEFKKENPKQTIESLQAKIRKKDQELAQLREESETRRKIGSDAMMAIDRLNGKLAEQQAYIGRLETAYMDEVKARRKGKSGSPILEAMSALEKVRTG